jgi:site-specific recombinase XerD
VRVLGKGNKERFVPLVAGAIAALDAWLVARGGEPGGLFRAINKGGRFAGTGLSAQTVYSALRKRAAQAGVARLSPHDLRRTFVGDLLDAGADLATVQQLAGHAAVTTTARYDRRGEHARRRAAALLHVPFQPC